MLVEVKTFGEYALLGQTKDDAAGEAFDKVAKIMGLGYPGGAALDKLASTGNPKYHRFPRAVMKQDYQFSYSGIKTAVALYLQKLTDAEFEESKADIAASFQEAVVDVLVAKTIRAVKERQVLDVTISGGVAANSRLRHRMGEELKKVGGRLFYPSIPLCTDNAAMIAAAGFYNFEKHGPAELVANAIPNLRLI
jgi:N6-L-threonylcarbamoyladenine synthase